jgi:hypothetical protein
LMYSFLLINFPLIKYLKSKEANMKRIASQLVQFKDAYFTPS